MGYDSQKLNDQIGKHISKQLLENQSLEENLTLLRSISKLNFKPAYIEKVEQAVVHELLEKKQFVEQRPEVLIAYMRAYKGRRKVSQVEIGLCIKVIDQYYDTLTIAESQQRDMLRAILFTLENQCKAEFSKERLKIIELIQRDPTLTEDDNVQEKLEAAKVI